MAERIGWVLTGGGLTGVAGQAGALLALQERGLEPSCIVGLSAGSLVGGMLASGRSPDEIASALLSVSPEDYWDPIPRWALALHLRNKLTGQTGYVRGRKLRRWLERNLLVERIEDCPIPFRPVAVNISRGAQEAPREGNLAQWIRASTAIPLIFATERIGGDHYWDGGLTGSVPLDTMADEFGDRIDRILVVTTLRSVDGAPGPSRNDFERKGWTPLRALEQALDAVVQNIKRENMEADGIPVELLQLPVDPVDLDDTSEVPRAMVQGREFAERWLLGGG